MTNDYLCKKVYPVNYASDTWKVFYFSHRNVFEERKSFGLLATVPRRSR